MDIVHRTYPERPLLLLDVDGVISLWGFDTGPEVPPRGMVACLVDGLPHFLSNAVAARFMRLSGVFDCAWCTGWEDRADTHLPQLLGLPSGWPHLVFGDLPGDGSRHWKLASIDAYAGPERPVAWVDDQFDPSCEAWARERPGATLLVRTDPAVGLTEIDTTRLADWARAPRRYR